MEFKRANIHSKLDSGPILITPSDTEEMIKNIYLHEQRSFFIVTAEGDYDDSRIFNYGIIPDKIKQIESAFKSGKTIIIKEVEFWNQVVINECKSFGQPTNVHLYMTPKKGTTFGWHSDDRDVYIYMQCGEKTFEVEEPDHKISTYKLKAGSRLYIPYGAKHRALQGEHTSIHLGFGVWKENICIQNEYESFPIDVSLNFS
jgi:cupin superfamily acireductone dioxygenase involved in methionine salvage